MKLKIFLILIIIILVSINIYAQDTDEDLDLTEFDNNYIENMDIKSRFLVSKDPFTAGVLSFFFPGAGQIYNENYTKGFAFFGIDLSMKTLLLVQAINLQFKYINETKNDYIVEWKEIESIDKSFLFTTIFAIIWFDIFNTIDAVNGAKRYNKKYIRNPAISFSENGVNISYNIKF